MRERSGLLSAYWYAAARVDEVNAKRPLGRVVLGERLCLWRDPRGAAVVFEDRCLHRNAPLSKGALFDGCLGCPYHGWTYDAEGRVVAVPSEGPSGGEHRDLQVRRYPVREQDGLVWVWMGEGAPDKEPFRMPYWDTPGWSAYYMTTPFANGVTHLVENFMDVPHTVFVHRGWFRTRSRKQVLATVERTADSVLVTYEQPNDAIGFTGRIVNPRGLPMAHTDKFYMPNNTRVDYSFGDAKRPARAFVITSTCTPISEFETTVYTLISYRFGWFNRLAKLLLPFYTRQVIEQDVEIMQVQGASLRHRPPEFRSTEADRLHVFIESLREWDRGGRQGSPPEPRIDRIAFWV